MRRVPLAEEAQSSVLRTGVVTIKSLIILKGGMANDDDGQHYH
jgi:hypothetical protein